MPGAVVERARGGLVVADQQGFAGLDFATGKLERWAQPEQDKPGNRLNDGKVDPRGRFWAGSLQLKEDATGKGAGALWCLGTDHRATLMLPDVTCANGLAWTADERTFYYIDTPTQEIAAFDVDLAKPAISNRRVAVRIDAAKDGWPDGMCIDAEGMLWVGHWGGWAVHRYDPRTGKRLATVKVPVERTTSCCFGGERLDELWITTAGREVEPGDAKQPHAGGLFRARVGVEGVAAALYAG
jgi:sugar lactone lactonase YvrE